MFIISCSSHMLVHLPLKVESKPPNSVGAGNIISATSSITE
jgi:ADP-dependent phosphofructokinase/glucokinase